MHRSVYVPTKRRERQAEHASPASEKTKNSAAKQRLIWPPGACRRLWLEMRARFYPLAQSSDLRITQSTARRHFDLGMRVSYDLHQQRV